MSRPLCDGDEVNVALGSQHVSLGFVVAWVAGGITIWALLTLALITRR